MTDEEKAEARGTDRRAAAIVDRCDDMPPEVWERLHGAVRSLHPAPATDPFVTDSVRDGFDRGGVVGPVVGPGSRRVGRPGVRHRRRGRGGDRPGRERSLVPVAPRRRAGSVPGRARPRPSRGSSATSTAMTMSRSRSTVIPRPSRSTGRAGTSTSTPTSSSPCRGVEMTGSAAPRVLVAGIGNLFLGDDGFGVEVATGCGARRCPTVCASSTSASAVSTSRTSCSTVTTRSCSSTPLPMGEPPGRSR